MSREIKFRVRDISGNQFWDDSLGDWKIEFESGKEPNLIVLQETFSPVGEQEFYWRNIEDVVFQQFTGLKDKNGKDIYEGDIVDRSYINPMNRKKVKQHYVIELKNGIYRMKYINDKPEFDRFLWMQFQLVEVIGNVFENPELLEGSADE